MDDEEETDQCPNKVVMIGSEGVGKTSLFLRFKTGRFCQTTRTPKGYDGEHCKEWTVNGHRIKMTLFDTAGMERFTSTIPPTYFRNAKVIILVYSIDSADSVSEMPDWIANYSISRLGDAMSDIIPILVGNKYDLLESRDVSLSRVKETANLCGISEENLFEVSAYSGHGFKELFDKIAILIDNPYEKRNVKRKTIIASNSPSDSDNNNKKQSCAASCNN